jgi:hypothetical protein
MTARKMNASKDIIEVMLIHENGDVTHRDFRSYESLVAFRERNKAVKVIIKEGTIG